MSTSALLGGRSSIFFKAFNTVFLGVPGWLDRKFQGPKTEGPRLDDLTVQTSSYGVEIGRVHGTIGISGNLIWLENNLLKETAHKNKKKSGGKGGSSSSTTPDVTYTYSATFAIGICEGPIDGLARIWCGDKLIYNAGSGDVATIIASNVTAKGMRIHLGTDNQLPDARIEAARGVGNTPAFRGLAYVVFDDFQLADYGNTLQATNFKFEVVQVANVDSVRNLINTTTAVVYERGGGATFDYGIPYLNGADGIISVSTATGQYFSYSLDGALIGKFGSGNVIPDYDGNTYYSGYMGDDLVGVSRDNLDRSFGEAKVITPPRLQSNLPSGHYLYSLTLSCDGAYMMAVTGTVPEIQGLSEGRYFWLMDQSGGILKSGTLQDPISRSNHLGLGRVAQISFSSSCMEEGAEFIWGALGNTVSLFQISNNELILVKSFSQASSGNSFAKTSILASAGVAYLVGGDQIMIYTRLAQVLKAPPTLSEVISSEVLMSDLILSSDIETTSLNSVVKGYAVQGGTIRSAIEPLQTAYRFDVVQSGYRAKFLNRGSASVMTIPWSDLISDGSGDSTQSITEEREMDTQLPVKTTVKYLDAVREYSVSNQTFERLSTRAIGKEDIEVPLVMTATEALQTAEILTLLPWLERSTFSFKLPPPYQLLEPCDVVTIEAPWETMELRIGKIDYGSDGAIDCSAVPNRSSIYSSQAVAVEPVAPISTIAVPGPTMAILMDIPLISENLQSSPSFVVGMLGYTSSWTGAQLVQSSDEGQTWTTLQGFDGMTTAGICSDTLPESRSTLIDQRALTVQLLAGELESISRDQMLSGQHYVAYGADGRWEILRFQNADLREDGSYRVSGFVRGEKGTEWATGTHQVGDYFVLLDDPDNLSIGLTIESILSARRYRAVTLGADIDSASDINFTYKAVNLEPLSPVYPTAKRASDGGISFVVQRRSRLSSSWWANGVEAPLGESALAFEADVMSGFIVKRTLSSSSGTFTYSASDQVTDFGSVQGSITFRVYQLSTVVGRGYPLEVSV